MYMTQVKHVSSCTYMDMCMIQMLRPLAATNYGLPWVCVSGGSRGGASRPRIIAEAAAAAAVVAAGSLEEAWVRCHISIRGRQ